LLSLGFGNVGQALARMLAAKEATLRDDYDLTFTFTGVYTRITGALSFPGGVSASQLVALGWPVTAGSPAVAAGPADPLEFIRACPADVVLELSALDPMTGQPATDYIRTALRSGRHVVTANKGPIAHAYRELRALAAENGVRLRFESTVMDGTPIFGMSEASLPATVLEGFRGLLNSTSNYVLSLMAQGQTVEEGIAAAQKVGVAEANPAYDLEGWDASVKATVLANVLMGADLRPADVRREGLGAEAMRLAQAALLPGQTLKQVVEATRENGAVRARVRLAALPPSDLFAHLSGMETAVVLHTDTMRDLTIVEGEGDPGQTAFGVLADLVAIARASGAADPDRETIGVN
jgi:homoserine dehydrogenase